MVFTSGLHFPDMEYGALYETFVRAVSDFHWKGMIKEDDFWIRRKFLADEQEDEMDDWEFLILVTMEKTQFAAQLNSIFQKVNPSPPPTEAQVQAARRALDRVLATQGSNP